MTTRLESPLKLPQVGVDAAEPGSMTAIGQPATRLLLGGGG